MRLAIVYWRMIHSVGGIATVANCIREAAIRAGDTCHVLLSANQKTKRACVFPQRKWISGGDTKIWICGEAPHHPENVEETIRWLEANYDAILFAYICPNKISAYPEPMFMPIYSCKLPKVGWLADGYWDMYSKWALPCLPKLKGILYPQESYAIPLRSIPTCPPLKVCPQPFSPQLGRLQPRSKTPLLVWPSQWKDIKGIKPFLQQVPYFPQEISVELYSCGVRYYQLRKESCWQAAVGQDKFKGFDGEGRATYFGNVDLPELLSALQRAWFTVNLQGMRNRQVTYKRGSYNYTEVEALYYGACPVLHESTRQTILPPNSYLTVKTADDIPSVLRSALDSGYALDPVRFRAARDFVLDTHLASRRYKDLLELL